MIYYNPIDNFYKSIVGAVCADDEIFFRIRCDFDSCFLCMRKEGEQLVKYKMSKMLDYFEISLSFSTGLYWYYFEDNNGLKVGCDDMLNVSINCPLEYQLSVYDKDYKVPNIFNNGIIYQIFPDRFNKKINRVVENGKVLHQDWLDKPCFLPNDNGEVLNNDFFGGDFLGIIDKIPYLKKLSVSAIYLNPIFKAYSNHRYDTGDYMDIDSLLGTKEDFILLIEKCKENGIGVILDGVFNHTGVDSLYFNKNKNYNSVGAYMSQNSPYFDWYNFSSWPNDYKSWWGIKTLPTTNKESGYVDYVCGENGVLDYWCNFGISGWRLDVVDELPSSFVQKIRKAIKKNNNEAIVIGEVWEDASNKISYGKRREYFLGKELDYVMNYPLRYTLIEFIKTGNSEPLIGVIKNQIDHYPNFVLKNLMNNTSTHDSVRIFSALMDIDFLNKTKLDLSKLEVGKFERERAIKKVKCYFTALYSLYGVPCVYYGDERLMEGLFDPYNRCTIDWNKKCDFIDYVKKLGDIRGKYSCFIGGKTIVEQLDYGCITIKRQDDNCETLTIINVFGRKKIDFSGELLDLLTNKIYNNKIELEENCCVILINAKNKNIS